MGSHLEDDCLRVDVFSSKDSGSNLGIAYVTSKSARLCLAYGPGTKKNDKRVLNQFIEKAIILNSIKMNDEGLVTDIGLV